MRLSTMNVRVGLMDDGFVVVVDLENNLTGANADAHEKLVVLDKKLDRMNAPAILIFMVV
jgi:hypothetical protein